MTSRQTKNDQGREQIFEAKSEVQAGCLQLRRITASGMHADNRTRVAAALYDHVLEIMTQKDLAGLARRV